MNVTYTRPYLYPKQKAFVDCTSRYTVIEASTKAGKTHACIIWLFEKALKGKEGYNYWWVAPVYQQAKIAFGRLKRAIPDKSLYQSNESELTITLINGAVISFKSAEKPDNLYGDDVYAAVLDEASRMREESFWAIRSTLTKTNGQLKIIGNVKGELNWCYKLARRAERQQDKQLAYFKLTAYDAVEGGVLKKEEIEDAKSTLPPDVFDELYLCIPRKNKKNLFAYAFDEERHLSDNLTFDNNPIYLSFDFNKIGRAHV